MSSRTDRGFTLIEAMVAMAIMGLVLVSLSAATSQALRAESKATMQLEAVALAEAKMNEITALPTPGLGGYVNPREGGFDEGFEDFRWRAVVRPLEASNRLYRAAVNVSWDEGSFDLETVIYRVPRIGVGVTQ